jgi:hypothetical protein
VVGPSFVGDGPAYRRQVTVRDVVEYRHRLHVVGLRDRHVHASSHLENRWERLNCCNHWKWSQAFVRSLRNRLSRLFAKSPTTEWASFSKPGPGWAARFCGLLSRPRSCIHNGSTDWKPRKYLPKTQSRNRKCPSFSFTARSTATSRHAIPEGFKLGIKASCCGRYQRQITAAQSALPSTSSRPD